MYRESLGNGNGMWLKFTPSRVVKIWMHQTLIHLDMVFIFNGFVIATESNVHPCGFSYCPTYGPDKLVDSVIELAAGEMERLKISVGDTVDIKYR